RRVGKIHRKCRQRRRRRDRRVPPVVRRRRTCTGSVRSDLTRKERSMHKRRWSLVVAAVLVAGVAVTAALAAPSHQAAGKTYYFIPKETLDPDKGSATTRRKHAIRHAGEHQVGT